jgi:F-type H+-transporting ATPase subunit b
MILLVLMRYSFGFNTNIIETNVLNLRVVVGIVFTQVGEALKVRLDTRRNIILSILQEADKKKETLQQQLEEARKAVKEAELISQDIQSQSIQAIEKEVAIVEQKLREDLKRFRENKDQIIKLERQRERQYIRQYITGLAIKEAENRLIESLSSSSPFTTKHKELNKRYVQDTFRKLKGLPSLIFLFNIYNLFFFLW